MKEIKKYQNYMQIQEIERKRIARELHDTSLQNLTNITYKIELAQMYLDKDVVISKLQLVEINKEIREIIDCIRETILDLRPMVIDDLGFKESVEQFIENKIINNGININYEIEQIYLENNDDMLNLYRVIQECITNSIKHSNSNKITLIIKNNIENISIEIFDNGIGFDYNNINKNRNSHFGLQIINERIQFLNGKFEIESKINNGTKIFISIPKNKEKT